MALYEEDGVIQPENSLYTAEDTVPVPDTNVGNYSVLKGIAAFATGEVSVPDSINFNHFVDENWRKTVPEQNTIDRSLAAKAANEGNVNIVQQTLDSVAARNKMYGELSTNNANEVRAKLKELTNQAVETTAVRNPSVLFNNTPDEINESTARISSRLSAAATLDKAIQDGKSWSSVGLGFLYEFTPMAAEQGAAIDRVAIKYGVPADAISRATGRSQTKSYLQAAFNGQPEEEKGEWLSNLYKDLKDSWLITDWQAALLIQEVATNEEQSWDGLSDWLDRLGVVGAALSGGAAIFKSAKLFKSANAINNVERTLAASGGKNAIMAAETAKIATQVANKQRLQAVGVVAGELTGITTAIDLSKLVTMNAAKVLPDVITTAADDLQKTIRAPVEKLIAELQDVISAKGVRASEAAIELENLQRIYSKANNPNIHSLDNFTLSEDGLVITGKVFYKPDTSTSFLTKEAAEAYIKVSDPTGSINMKVVPDTTNTGFLVEESVKTDLQLRKAALEAQILEEVGKSKVKKTTKKAVTEAEVPPLERAPAPKSLTDSKPRYKTSMLSFEDDVDKAAYQIGSKTATSKSDKEIKTWLQSVTGWDDSTIAGHAQSVRDYIKANETVVDEAGNIRVASQVPVSRPTTLSQASFNQSFTALQSAPKTITVGNITMSDGVKKAFVVEFVTKLGKSLGMENRKLVVMDYEDMVKSKDPTVRSLVAHIKQKHTSSGAVHYDYGNGQSFIVMRRGTDTSPISLRRYMENFAHEYGHAFEAEFATKYFGIINSSFNKWLRAKNIKFKGDGINKSITDAFPPEALLEYRSIMNAEDLVVNWIDKWAGGNVGVYQAYESQIHKWASSYSEFFAENFAKWAFTDEIPTTILGQTFKKLVDGFKLIISEVTGRLTALGMSADVGKVDKNIATMLNTHIKQLQDEVVEGNATMNMIASESKRIKPSLATLQKELDVVSDELAAIEDAEKGLKTGWLVEQPINKTLDYSIVGKYSDSDINSAARFAMGDWALSTSSELYSQRVVGINQSSRYQKLLTNFVRPSIEKLSKAEMVALNDALVIGDKEGKLFTEHELAGQGLSSNAREAYYKVRALRDVMWQMRNDVATKSMTRRGYVQLNTGIKFDDTSNSLFAKPTTPKDGTYIYLADTGTMQRMGTEFREEAVRQGYIFYEAAEPVLIDGKYRKTFAFKDGAFASQKIDTVIPYRAGEYRRIYSDEYFVKIKSTYEVDGVLEEVTSTHRTATNIADANAYVKALSDAQALHKAGKLTIQEASRLMQPYGWRPEEIIDALDSGRFGTDFKVEVKYNRTDDDYVTEAIGLSSNFSSKRGDKVLSVFGKDTVNTVSPLDSVAAEIGNTAYVASTTEWRESHIQRWFNTFADDLPANVRDMTPDNAFRYMLNNKGMYVGQSKRLTVAEKVQDYIIAQMNIPTKEEKEYLGFMRMISESIEGKVGGKPVMKLGAALRATKDYPTWARTVAFHSFFAFNPVQFFMQGMNAFNAVAISPVHGLASAKSSALYAMALFSDQESIWQTVAKTNKMTNLGLGMSEEEFVEVVRAIRRTGLMDGINTSSLYGAEVGKYGIMNKLTRRVGDVAATPFNSGEGYSRLVSFDIARREYIANNPGSAWWTDDALGTILKRQDDLTQNMTRANTASWQQGWKSIPAQFIQYQVKLMMNVVQSLMGNPRAFTQKEALQLLVTHAVVMGTAGNFLWPFRDLITEVMPEDMTEEARLYVQQGVVAGMIASVTDGEAKLAIGSRFNTFKYYEDIVKGLLDPEKTFMEIASGPSGFAALRILGGFGEAFSIVAKAPMTMSTLQIALTEIGKGSFSFFNNIEKARIAMNNYNQVQSGAGGAMYRVTDTEAWMIGMGIPPAAQEDLSVMYSSSKKHTDEIKEASKAVGKHAMLALTALRNNDSEGHRTHAAVVQAILNNYTGSDLQLLYREAYKVEAFTQYEKMLTDQAVKDWAVKDLVVNTGVNK
jgi:hypothetical protein